MISLLWFPPNITLSSSLSILTMLENWNFMIFFPFEGIISYHSCVETLEQNSMVERKHQHILNVTRALLFKTRCSIMLLVRLHLTAIYLIYCTPSPLLANKTPYELLHNKRPYYADLRTFGCLCYGSTFLVNVINLLHVPELQFFLVILLGIKVINYLT